VTDPRESDPTLEQTPFDRALRRLRRDRAAALSAGASHPLLQRMADDILERLSLVTRRFERALDLGCGPGLLTGALRAQGLDVTAADPGRAFAAAADGVQCDEDRLPFPPESFDLVVSAGTLDSVNDLPGALVQARRLLRPDGLFLAAFVGAGSLPILRGAMRAAEEQQGLPAAPRIHPQIDLRAAGDLLSRAGFALPVADGERVTLRYPSFPHLVHDLRMLGWTNILSSRSKRPFTRLGYAAAAAAFGEAADADGKVAERFEILHLSGWAPSPDQPRPARRGSGTFSLADALGRPTP
jgi:NADH dehydrogenase [ubiquinone] 1 alpha subcomplex assembly factor 5